MATIEITLPDELAEAAQNAGLLASASVEQWLREQLRKQRVDELFTAMDRMAAHGEPPVLSPEELAREIAGLRRRRQTGGQD